MPKFQGGSTNNFLTSVAGQTNGFLFQKSILRKFKSHLEKLLLQKQFVTQTIWVRFQTLVIQ